jgi:Pyridoxal-phosphate dependent enzyme
MAEVTPSAFAYLVTGAHNQRSGSGFSKTFRFPSHPLGSRTPYLPRRITGSKPFSEHFLGSDWTIRRVTLLADLALATRAASPNCELYGVEPEVGKDGQSFRSSAILHVATPNTIADGAQAQHLGNCTFPITQRDVDDVLTVIDALIDCMRLFAVRMKLVIEPIRCLGFAAAPDMRAQLLANRFGVIVSGGNVDIERYSALLMSGISEACDQ